MTYQEAKEMIMDMYPGRLYVGKKEVCTLLGLSTNTLDRRLKRDCDLAKVAKGGEKGKKTSTFSCTGSCPCPGR